MTIKNNNFFCATLSNAIIARRAQARRSNLLWTLLFCCLFVPSLVFAETIHYTIHQLGFNGKASLTMAGPKEFKGYKTLLIVFRAKGTNYSDEEDIYVDPKTYKPLFVERDFNLNIFGQGKTLEDYVTTKGEIHITKKDGDRVTEQIINNVGAVDNIYGFIFRYRKEGTFKTGDHINMTLPTRNLEFKFIGHQPLKINGKYYDSLYMQSEPVRYKIWFDSSAHKWPLRITGSYGFINSVMTMTGYEEQINDASR
ncbi:MAG: hypothetical protein HQL13_01890 [Candidatus Omnitrophica bacterium]|nr:hypothetical protein [Candidatus Omnitrophota bacterium]